MKIPPKETFLQQLQLCRLPAPEAEVLFALPRKWRFDFAWPDARLAVEYNGIFRSNHRQAKTGHSTVGGLMRDYEKINEAQLRGWRVIIIDAKSVADGRAVEWVERALQGGDGEQTAGDT